MTVVVQPDFPVSTGQFLALGTQDPNWSASYQGAKATATYANLPSTYWKQFSTYAGWITPPLVSGTSDSGNFTFSTSFDIKKFDPATYFLNADIATDDALVGITVNKVSVPLLTPCTKDYQYFECLLSYKFSGHFVTGTNTIAITVNNIGGVNNPVGLYVKFGI
jgi:hypothetical protein